GKESRSYYIVDEIQKKFVKGFQFEDDALTNSTGHGRMECNNENILIVKKGIPDADFLAFVFSLPYEEQNIKANKVLLKLLDEVDSCGIMLEEYSKDKLFKDYFAVLDEKCRKEVVRSIKALPKRNKFLDSWLFKEGFDIDVDYLKLYKEDTEGFIRYFEYHSTEVRKLIISDLLGYEHVNPEVIEFLEKKHSHLLRDTAFNDK
ncbi:MAG: hypothetical protein Q8N77_01845, partial [Nanoarchaeota archaeon]|nr:hypothetical protein [Nanoarchaeota archaeon]